MIGQQYVVTAQQEDEILRRWPSIKPSLDQRLVLTGIRARCPVCWEVITCKRILQSINNSRLRSFLYGKSVST